MEKLTLLSRKQRKIKFNDFCIPGLPLNNLNLGGLYVLVDEKGYGEGTIVMDVSVNKTSAFANSRDDLAYFVSYQKQLEYISLRQKALFDSMANLCDDARYGKPNKLKVIYNELGGSANYNIKLDVLSEKEFKVNILHEELEPQV